MATQLFAPTANAAVSSAFEVEDGAPQVVNLTGGAKAYGKAYVLIEYSESGTGNFSPVGRLDAQKPADTLVGAGFYRLRKKATKGAIGASRSGS